VGVHYEKGDLKNFAELVPDEAEVVVDYKNKLSQSNYGSIHHQYGTALIPKKTKQHKEN